MATKNTKVKEEKNVATAENKDINRDVNVEKKDEIEEKVTAESSEEATDETIDDIDDTDPKFTKDQILQSHWYSHRRDILSTLLENDGQYSLAKIDRLIKEFMSKGVE